MSYLFLYTFSRVLTLGYGILLRKKVQQKHLFQSTRGLCRSVLLGLFFGVQGPSLLSSGMAVNLLTHRFNPTPPPSPHIHTIQI